MPGTHIYFLKSCPANFWNLPEFYVKNPDRGIQVLRSSESIKEDKKHSARLEEENQRRLSCRYIECLQARKRKWCLGKKETDS